MVSNFAQVMKSWNILAAAGLWSAAALPGHAMGSAATTEWADTTVTLGEVGVTAIKSTTAANVTAASATTVGSAQVERLNITAIKGVSDIAPNFYIPDYGSRMTSSVYVRGLGARIDQPVVGLNVDNVPYLNKDNFDFDMTDVERIEVLRGPQSTLYGRNTMGGQVNVFTLSPMKVQGLRARVGYGSGNTLRAALAGYGKLTDRLGMSLSGSYMHTDGLFRNDYNGKNCDVENHGSLRWKTVWQPSATISIENTASGNLLRQGGYPYASVETGRIAYNDTCFYRRTSLNDGLTVEWRPGAVTLSSITSVQYINDNMTLDQDFSPQDVFTLTQRKHEWTFTQDFVAKGRAGEHYSWLAGLFGFYRSTDMKAPVTMQKDGIAQITSKIPLPSKWNGDSFVLHSDFDIPVKGAALYHQGSWVSDRWTFTFGARLDVEHTAMTYNLRTATGLSVTMPPMGGRPSMTVSRDVNIDEQGRMSKTYMEFLPKLAVTYALGDDSRSNVYASVSKGYKSGGYNTQMFSDILTQMLMDQLMPSNAKPGADATTGKLDPEEVSSYRPEKSWNYEVGTHLDMMDGSLTVDGSLFLIRCRDQQLTVFPDEGTGRRMTNAGRTRSMGVELASRWLTPVEGLSVNAAWGYTDARFRSYRSGGVDYRGKVIPYAPQHTLFAAADYVWSINRGALKSVTFNANCRGVGRIMWDDENTVEQPFYALAGGSVAMDFGRFNISLWGENLTDTQYNTFYFVSMKHGFLQSGKPRTAGVTVRMTL